MKYRKGTIGDIENLKLMGKLLWPDSTEGELDKSFKDTFASPREIAFVSQSETGELTGFTRISVRSEHVEGSTSSPVGYLESIFVYPGYRKQEVGRHLVELGEKWCIGKGCKQMGSDTSISKTDSTEFHKNIGFHVTSKSSCFIKDLA